MLTLMRSVASLSAAAAWNLSGPGLLAYRLVAVRTLNGGGERRRFRGLTGRVLGRGCDPSPENFGTFSLEMAHFGANSVVF